VLDVAELSDLTRLDVVLERVTGADAAGRAHRIVL